MPRACMSLNICGIVSVFSVSLPMTNIGKTMGRIRVYATPARTIRIVLLRRPKACLGI